MSLTRGEHFGRYELIDLLGAGGMGEVYLAHDSTLGRNVALKTLRAEHQLDERRLARFEREAQALALLNHPNIAVLHGVECEGAVRALVMELIDGDTLADRLAGGARLPVREATQIALQIARALDAAHARGVIHRDLTPANIKIRDDGSVKVLDFGLATLVDAAAVRPSAPAIALTAPFEVIGTAAYMSPEQARGQEIDRRSDIWAFGCVFYQMLAGRRAFEGSTPADVIASVLDREPDWTLLPADLPSGIDRVLRRCLVKESHRRLRDIGDAMIDLEETGAAAQLTSRASFRRGRLPTALVAAALAVVALAAWWHSPDVSGPDLVRRTVPLTTLAGMEMFPSFSPDGRQIAFTWDGGGNDASGGIYIQGLGAETPVRLTGHGATDTSPVWSPDGDRIAFMREGALQDELFIMSSLGTSERKVASFSTVQRSPKCVGCVTPLIAWAPDGRSIVVAGKRTGSDATLVRVGVDGTLRESLLPPVADGEYFDSPAYSPSGDALAAARCAGNSISCTVTLVALDAAGRPRTRPTPLTQVAGTIAGIAWDREGQTLLFSAASVWGNSLLLWRVATDRSRPAALVDVGSSGMHPVIAQRVPRLAYVRRNFDVNIWRVMRGGQRQPVASSTLGDMDASYSPDGSRLAFVTDRGGGASEVWTADRDGGNPVSLTRGVAQSYGSPRWSPDGRHLAFDGRGADGQWHVWVMEAAGGQPRYVGQGNLPSWSHDGRWLYMGSLRSGMQQVWRMTPEGLDAQQLTARGGSAPRESLDGRSVYFTRGGALHVMPVTGGAERELIPSIEGWSYAQARDGIYFVTRTGLANPRARDIRVVDPDGGSSRSFGSFEMDYHWPGLSVTPDGSAVLVYGVESVSADLVLLEGYR